MDAAPSKKQLTHERIVDAAARAIRRAGFDGVGVAEVMKEAGLTHGGFYAHFASRDALICEALERAGQDGAARLAPGRATRQARGASPLRAFVEQYLSDQHLASPEQGCAVAALAGEMSRQSGAVAQAAAQRVRTLVSAVREVLPRGTTPAQAGAVAGQLVGAMQLARTLGDNAEGRALLAAARRAVLAQHDTDPSS
jgi:TetR/AcrR family transcriptional regulator, transcriptional repressor for nem operon